MTNNFLSFATCILSCCLFVACWTYFVMEKYYQFFQFNAWEPRCFRKVTVNLQLHYPAGARKSTINDSRLSFCVYYFNHNKICWIEISTRVGVVVFFLSCRPYYIFKLLIMFCDCIDAELATSGSRCIFRIEKFPQRYSAPIPISQI